MDTVLQSKKRVKQIVSELSSIDRETKIQSVAALPGGEEGKVVLFTDDARINLSPEAAMRLSKHLLDMATIAFGIIPTLEEKDEKGIYTQ